METCRTIMTIDLGNTAMKVSVFEDARLVRSIVTKAADTEAIHTLLTLCSVDGIAMCTTGADTAGIADTLSREGDVPFLELDHDTPLPIRVEYGTPGTLGLDRVAAAVGALREAPRALVVDAGTAMTADLVADGAFLGGNISPGIALRFRSLNKFTSRLPLVKAKGETPAFGRDTDTAIRSGVVLGIVAEIEADFTRACLAYPDVKLILTGGDADLLTPLLRERNLNPLTDTALLGKGLVSIFNYNNGNE